MIVPSGRGPRALLFLRRDTARCGDSCGKRPRFENDDPAPTELGRRPVAEEAIPAGSRPRPARRRQRPTLPRGAPPPARATRRRRSACGGTSRAQAADAYASRSKSSAGASGAPNRAADAIIAALSPHSGSGARAASGRAARSSLFAATPPTTAILSVPSLSAACRSRSVRARTIARWYDAARSARRSASPAVPRSRTV